MSDTAAVGLDVGATKTLGVAVDAAGRVLAQTRRATAPGAEGIVATAATVVAELRATTGSDLPVPVGVGVPGLVDAARGALKHAVNLGVDGQWFDLGDRLSERLGAPVAVENDVNAAALGAAAVTGVDDLVLLSIGTGLAAGLVLDGRLRRGPSGAAGEVGHVPVDPAGPVCQCGQRGCLETVASGRALAEAWPSGDVPAAQALFAAAAAGDPDAVRVQARFAGGVADAVRVLALALDPAVVVLGGGVSHLGEPLRAAVARALEEQAATSPFLASLRLPHRLRVLPSDRPVAAVGAALLGRREPVA